MRSCCGTHDRSVDVQEVPHDDVRPHDRSDLPVVSLNSDDRPHHEVAPEAHEDDAEREEGREEALRLLFARCLELAPRPEPQVWRQND